MKTFAALSRERYLGGAFFAKFTIEGQTQLETFARSIFDLKTAICVMSPYSNDKTDYDLFYDTCILAVQFHKKSGRVRFVSRHC